MERVVDRLIIGVFLAIAVLIGADLVGDWQGGTSVAHVAMELLIMLVAVAAAGLLLVRGRRRIHTLTEDLETTRLEAERRRHEAERYRQEAHEALRGLSEAIDQQLERWELTPAEREVALLLLKGLSLKEIATVRETSERTARQQAQAVYRKAGLSGRNELSAFFLEDLFVPPGAGESS